MAIFIAVSLFVVIGAMLYQWFFGEKRKRPEPPPVQPPIPPEVEKDASAAGDAAAKPAGTSAVDFFNKLGEP